MLATTTAPAQPIEYELTVKAPEWARLRKATNTEADAKLAKAIRLDRSTVYRVMTGAEPSSKFVAHTLAAFPFATFDRLFAYRPRS